jgi:hypothetical protein
MKQRVGSLKKINNTDKAVAELTKRRKNTKINKIREKKVDSTSNYEKQRIIRKYFKNLYSNKLENLGKNG